MLALSTDAHSWSTRRFRSMGPSWGVPNGDALSPEIRGPIRDGDRCGELVPRLEVGGVGFLPGEEHPPLERRLPPRVMQLSCSSHGAPHSADHQGPELLPGW